MYFSFCLGFGFFPRVNGFFKFGEETDEGQFETCFKAMKVVGESHKVKPGRCFHSRRELREGRAVPLPTVGREPLGVRSVRGG